LGHVIDKDGLKTSEKKVSCISKMPVPKNVDELKSFLGMINYYGKFIKNLSTISSTSQFIKKRNTIYLE